MWNHECLFHTFVIIQNYLIYLIAKIIPEAAIINLVGSCVLWHTLIICVCVFSTSSDSGTYNMVLCSPRTSQFSKTFCSFYYRVILETKIWVLGVFTAVGVSMFQVLSSDSARKYMCVYWHIYMPFYVCLLSLSGSILSYTKIIVTSPTLLSQAYSSLLLFSCL